MDNLVLGIVGLIMTFGVTGCILCFIKHTI